MARDTVLMSCVFLFLFICTPEQVIDTYIIIVSQFHKYFYGNINFPQFIF